MVKAAYCGLPLKLEEVTKALNLPIEKQKQARGKALIKYFCEPCAPTKTNGGRSRNLPVHDPEKWAEFIEYCRQDVIAEIAVHNNLAAIETPEEERLNYMADQHINRNGVRIDLDLARKAIRFDEQYTSEVLYEIRQLTGLDNPNSGAQLKEWLEPRTVADVSSLTKETIPDIIAASRDPQVKRVLDLKTQINKTSIKKYAAMLEVACEDERARGLFQFYGAGRTGRWSGRLIQLQNLPRNDMKGLEDARRMLKAGDYESFCLVYGESVPTVLSELIRTALMPEPGKLLVVADYSAIEARVIAWLASEKWRLDVFETHGKIYEASASKMFGVPIEQITKGSDLRQKGKVAELALGYQGSVGALRTMGAERMGLDENEMKVIVNRWRQANQAIVELWYAVETAAIEAVEIAGRTVTLREYKGLTFEQRGQRLMITLPSSRRLQYREPRITSNAFGKKAIEYKGIDGATKQWVYQDTYGGKLVENIVQSIARDLLATAIREAVLIRDLTVVMHVHDEIVAEAEAGSAEAKLKELTAAMCKAPKWAKGLPLNADGYITGFYKKD